jgi:hypothetical protein
MALCFAALTPIQSAARDAVVMLAAVPVATAQCAAMLVMLWQRRAAPPFGTPKGSAPRA